MANRSLVYFLGFMVVWLAYIAYKCEEENRRLFNTATQLKEELEDQNRLIRTQQLYIEYLNGSRPLSNPTSPVH